MARDKVAFISYARKDGEAFATALKARLEQHEPEITLWMDRAEMAGGVDFLDQIRRAIDSVEFLILVMTPASIASDWVQKEWRYAREQGVCVCPVKGADDVVLDEPRKSLPAWMSRAHAYDTTREWDRFTNFLKSPCQATRVPFMAPALPLSFVRRPREFKAIVQRVLDDQLQNPRGSNVVLVGSGGFGKTTLAASLCHDGDVVAACDGGILWVTLGEQSSLLRELSKLYSSLTGETRTFFDADDAAIQVFARLETKRCLLVIDDVWEIDHLEPFLRPAPQTTRLFTTRKVQIAGEVAAKEDQIQVAELTSGESVELLTSRLDTAGIADQSFRRLATRLGEWPLLLELANSTLREQVQFDETVEGALKWVNQSLDEAGVTAFDRTDAAARNHAIAKTLEISLAGLGDMRERCLELSVFAEDADIPLSLAATVWKQSELQTRRMGQRLGNLSLIRLNLARSTFRIHDATRAYFASQLTDPARIHGTLADGWLVPALVTGDYSRRFAVFHLVEAMADPAQTAARCRQLVELVADQSFLEDQRQHDVAGIYRQLTLGLRRASVASLPEMPPLVAALGIAMRAYAVSHDPDRIFALARLGELDRAAAIVDLFDVDHEWRAAALLAIAWIGGGTTPDQAAGVMAKAAVVSDMQPLSALQAWAAHAPDGVPPGLQAGSGGPDLAYIAGLLERAGGTGAQTGIEPLQIEGHYPPGYPGVTLARFISEQDGPPLVDFARIDPATNTEYLRRYIAIHAANRYRYYRNRSLWALLDPILKVPDAPWVRQLVEELIVSALTITSIDFQDALPLTVHALLAKAGDAQAAAFVEDFRQELFRQASALSPARGQSDSWAHYQRRAAALGEIYFSVMGQPQAAAELLHLARTLPKGFAGFRAKSSLTLAEAFRLVTPGDVPGIDGCVVSAMAAAHRIQDYSFCFQMTCFVMAVQRHWPPSRPLPIDDVIRRFVDEPTHPDFCPVFVVGGQQYEFRPDDHNTLKIPEAVRQVRTLRGIADLWQCLPEQLVPINQPFDVDADLPDGTEVHLRDEEFVPLLAARFAAEALASAFLSPAQRTAQIQKLVPLAASNTTALDTVLARLLLSAQSAALPMPRPLLDLKPAPWETDGRQALEQPSLN